MDDDLCAGACDLFVYESLADKLADVHKCGGGVRTFQFVLPQRCAIVKIEECRVKGFCSGLILWVVVGLISGVSLVTLASRKCGLPADTGASELLRRRYGV